MQEKEKGCSGFVRHVMDVVSIILPKQFFQERR